MTRMKLGTAVLALTIAFGGGAATAQAYDSLRDQADQILNEYGFDIDPLLLSDEQLTQFQAIDDELGEQSRAGATTRIEGILMDDETTAAFVSDPGGEAAWSSLRANAGQILDQYGYDVDPELLTNRQLAEFRGIRGDLEDVSRAGAMTRIDGILIGNAATATFVSPDTATLMQEPRGQLKNNAEDMIEEYGYDVNVDTLTLQQLTELWFLRNQSDIPVGDRVQAILEQS